MTALKKEMEEILRIQRNADEMRVGADNLIEKANKKFRQLAARVKKGETTGDEIKDFVLLRYGFVNDEIEETYRDIQKRVEKHVGEFVFVYSAWDRHEGCTGFGGRGHYVRQHSLYLAVLKEGRLILDTPAKGLIFPTEVYAISAGHLNDAKLVNKNLSEDVIDCGYWTKADFGLNLSNAEIQAGLMSLVVLGENKQNSPELVLRIGDEDVNQWFNLGTNRGFMNCYAKMARDMLCRPNEEFFNKHNFHLRDK